MTPYTRKQPFLAGATFVVVLAMTLHQSFSTEAPPTAPASVTSTPQVPSASPSKPERGNYNVTNNNGTACLMASMGLQLNVTYVSSSQSKPVQEIVNLHPNMTKNMGSCDGDSATLILKEENTTLTFIFSLNSTSRKYHLNGLALSAFWPDMSEPFSASNTTLNYLRGTLGHSYMCREEQTLNVEQDFSLNTFQLQVQPFGINGDQFGAAEECELDEDDMLIPIIVGAALAGLVLVVLAAYLIGRKRSHAGYQTI
ncbi:lysosome-associated membrane glycoprotein 1b [Chanos chanos]|uniref:Lysosome-associated membrane glycoprotein 1 n=1 Tax=Chanos chanos TaxID=29144 RepID=A0A6J2WH55_CHACN|nr:lysosome-associated membrane glycoprotein 1-like [Chanos chanos]